MESDHGSYDWDAAFEALVAPLRVPRHVRVARAAWQVVAAAFLMLAAGWTLLRLIGDPLRELGRPWF